jgi:hypothetical protein
MALLWRAGLAVLPQCRIVVGLPGRSSVQGRLYSLT